MKKENVIQADLTDIVFEGRNQEYGGYIIRKEQNRNLMIGVLITGVAFALILLLPFLMQESISIIPKIKQEIIHELTRIEQILPPKIEEVSPALPPAPANPEPSPAAPSSQLLNPIPVPDKDVDDNSTMQDQDSILHNPGTDTRDGNENGSRINTQDGTGTGIAGTDTVPAPAVEPGLYDFHMGIEPSPMNMDRIRGLIKYPEVMIEMGMQGKATFRVLVDEEGNYVKHVCIGSSHKLFENACSKHLKKLQFEPGMQGDMPVKVWVNIPFIFRPPH